MSINILPKKDDTLDTEIVPAGRWRWYHGITQYIIVQVLTFGLAGLVSIARDKGRQERSKSIFTDNSYFKRLKQAKITPPSWAFGPAWTINNASVIYGQLRVLNKPANTPGRTAYLALQAATWLDYIAFNAAYFSLRSPINAFVLTLLFFVLTIASGFVAIFRLKDTRVALSLATLFVWLLIALTAATAQALWNRDEFYNVGPFVEPVPALLKETVR